MLAATFFTLQAPEPDHQRFSESRCSKVTLRSYPTRVLCVLTEHKGDAMHVALDLAIEMERTFRCHIAGDC